MAGSSDGGAHLLSFCGADFTTRLLTEWVPDVLTLEAAVARLTSRPGGGAAASTDRGVLAPGRGRRRERDRPRSPRRRRHAALRRATSRPAAGATSSTPSGYVATIVNGEVLLADGEWTGSDAGSNPARRPRASGVVARRCAAGADADGSHARDRRRDPRWRRASPSRRTRTRTTRIGPARPACCAQSVRRSPARATIAATVTPTTIAQNSRPSPSECFRGEADSLVRSSIDTSSGSADEVRSDRHHRGNAHCCNSHCAAMGLAEE